MSRPVRQSLMYATGEEVQAGDNVLYHRELGLIESVALRGEFQRSDSCPSTFADMRRTNMASLTALASERINGPPRPAIVPEIYLNILTNSSAIELTCRSLMSGSSLRR
jgi:hypothetical protein